MGQVGCDCINRGTQGTQGMGQLAEDAMPFVRKIRRTYQFYQGDRPYSVQLLPFSYCRSAIAINRDRCPPHIPRRLGGQETNHLCQGFRLYPLVGLFAAHGGPVGRGVDNAG